MKFIRLLILVIILSACAGDGTHKNDAPFSNFENFITLKPKHALGFTIQHFNSNYILDVHNPWQGARNVSYRYALHPEVSEFDSNFEFNQTITIPVTRVVCLSTTHIAFVDCLNESHSIFGVSGKDFVNTPSVANRIEKGLVRDVGFEQSINFELLLSLKPQVVFAYGVGAEMAGYLQKLDDLKIPVVFIGDYLEENPLGKAEWLKVFGLFFDKLALADSLFNQIEHKYLNIKENLAEVAEKPNVFINMPWKDAWFFPGSQSYMARLIEDAGGNYLLSHLKGNQSYAFSLEGALEVGANAQVWINTGSANSMQSIINEVPIARHLPPVANNRVFNNNNKVNNLGGNDFWESGVVNPHIILKDLIKILHPQSIEHELVFYKHIN